MSYADLCTYCNTLEIHVSRKLVRDKLFELTGRKIAFAVSSSLNPKDVRGMFLSVCSESTWVKQHGCDVVVLSRAIFAKTPGGNYCWDRFITVKEMMHVFDTQAECSYTGEKFEAILNSFLINYDGSSAVVESEIKAFWRALGVLCPERYRLAFLDAVRSGTMTNYDAALKFRIPEQYVPFLWHDRYLEMLKGVSN